MIKGWLDPVIASKINFTRKTADLLKFIAEDNLQSIYGGKDSWEYAYVEPVGGENARLEDDEKRAMIQEERDGLIEEFERETMEWITLGPHSNGAKDVEASRKRIVEKLRVNYWKLDPYIRAKTYYHRVGVIDNKGQVDFKAA